MEKCYAIMNGISRIIPLNIRKIPTPFDPIFDPTHDNSKQFLTT